MLFQPQRIGRLRSHPQLFLGRPPVHQRPLRGGRALTPSASQHSFGNAFASCGDRRTRRAVATCICMTCTTPNICRPISTVGRRLRRPPLTERSSMSAPYVSASAPVLHRAQETLDVHVTNVASGRCVACGELGPCRAWEAAVAVFARAQVLPRRVPAASRPELLDRRRVGPSIWAAAGGRLP